MKRFLVFILAIAMIATLAPPAEATQPDDPGARSAQAHAAVFERAVERMTEHLSLAPDGTLVLDVLSGRAIGGPWRRLFTARSVSREDQRDDSGR